MAEIELWRPFAGLGLFLFAMRLIESALEQVSGRGFRLFIRRHTDTPFEGVLSGTVATAVLQSSSLVGLMMLALVGAGVIEMRNALAVIFGANLGTAFTGWIVATIGFKLDLEALALPLIGAGGVLLVATRDGRAHQVFRFAFGLGLLLTGLEFLKSALEDAGQSFDLSNLAGLGPIEFLLFGVAFSAIVQSSSAAMAVTLSALYAGVVDLPSAAAIAIGADLGTVSTILLGAFKGSASKKRVAAGHLLYNLGTTALAFLLLGPLLGLIAAVGVNDPLIALVAFHSAFNLIGLIIFFPLLGPIARLLERRVQDTSRTANRHLGGATAAVPEASIEAVELETAHLLQRVIRQNLLVIEPPIRIAKGRLPVGPLSDPYVQAATHRSFGEEYQETKQLEGEILEFTLQTQTAPLDAEQTARIDRCQRAVREAVHSSKSLKDIHADLAHFELADAPILAAYGQRLRDVDIRRDRLDQADISSLLNANREMLTSCRSLIAAIAAYELRSEQLEALETLPDSVL